MAAINATVVDATMTELQAEVRLSHTAIGSSDADSLSLAFFTELLNVSGLMTDLSSLLPAEAVLIDKLEVETCYTLSNCIIMKQLWPPPPPAEPTVTFGSLQLTVETVQAITSSISTFVAGSVATTAAVSVASAAAGAAAGACRRCRGGSRWRCCRRRSRRAAGGGAGGAAAGGGASAAVGGLTPLLFGAQRFVTSGGTNPNVSALQGAVADSMGWAAGDFGFSFSSMFSANATIGRRLAEGEAENEDEPDEAPRRTAFDRLLAVTVVMGLLLLLTLLNYQFFVHRWKYYTNRTFYEARKNPKMFMQRRSSASSGGRRSSAGRGRQSTRRSTKGRETISEFKEEKSRQRRSLLEEFDKIKFRPFPSPLVFPGLPMLVIQIFASGVTAQAVRVCRQHGRMS